MNKRIEVDTAALYKVLMALIGPAHFIRELQVTREPAELFPDNPINTLINDYNAAVHMENEDDKPA